MKALVFVGATVVVAHIFEEFDRAASEFQVVSHPVLQTRTKKTIYSDVNTTEKAMYGTKKMPQWAATTSKRWGRR